MQSSYYQAEMSDEVAALAMADWITILGVIPQEAIERACTEWMTNEDRRPTPASIRKLALAQIEHPEPKPQDRAPPPVVISAEELASRRKQQAELRKEFPMLRKMPKGWD